MSKDKLKHYKRYLEDPTENIPKSTTRRWRRDADRFDSNASGTSTCDHSETECDNDAGHNSESESVSNTVSNDSDFATPNEMKQVEHNVNEQVQLNMLNNQQECQDRTQDSMVPRQEEDIDSEEICLEIGENVTFQDDGNELVQIELEQLQDSDDEPDEESASTSEHGVSNMDVHQPEMLDHQDHRNNDRSTGHDDYSHPISDGSAITSGQLMSLILAFIVRHRLSGVAMRDLITLITSVFPDSIPRSKYFFDKEFFKSTDNMVMHHNCSTCHVTISEGDTNCPSCDANFERQQSEKEGNYFLSVPLGDQIKDLFEHHDLNKHITRKNQAGSGMSDIMDGKAYNQPEIQEFLAENNNNITLTFNTDGVPVFKSSKRSFWPIFCTVNEINQEKKSEFVILHSLWLGPTKPKPNQFLKPFIKDTDDLYHNGIQWMDSSGNSHKSKCLALACVCDTVARPMLQGITQFNGRYGCSYCYHPGVVTPKGNGHVRVYPISKETHALRTHNEIMAKADYSLQPEDRKGVKGPSIFSLLPHFNMVDGIPPDYMHCVLLGVVRSITELWIDSSSHSKVFYLGRKTDIIDNRLISIKTPHEIARKPRSIKDRKFWKASEWRLFLLYYSPIILSELLPSDYFNHWMLLVNGVRMLIGNNITDRTIYQARLCLNKFVVLMESLYALENVSYNVHLLTHLCDCVENWGPLTTTSAFVFEDANGKLLSLIHGTQYADVQCVKWFSAHRRLSVFAERYIPTSTNSVQDAYKKISENNRSIKKAETFDGCTCLGRPKMFVMTTYHSILVERSHGRPVSDKTCFHHKRVCVKGHVFTSELYASKFRSDNSVVLLKDGTFCRIQNILVCKLLCSCESRDCYCQEKVVFLGNVLSLCNRQLRKWDTYCEIDLMNSFKLIDINAAHLTVFSASDIDRKCLIISNPSGDFVVPIMVFEKD